tara:strand:- start:371 stop:577 length:207 start_codon:yes stop_codon:yes gene_type:complete
MKYSKCCDAPIILTDLCSACKEHSDERRSAEIERAIVPQHYPDWDKENQTYLKPIKRKIQNESKNKQF